MLQQEKQEDENLEVEKEEERLRKDMNRRSD